MTRNTRSSSIFGLIALAASAVGASDLPIPDVAIADRVVVTKSERKLRLYKGDQVLREMQVALGLVPEGDKEQEGDFRTPEGHYHLAERNANSDYFLSIRVSYPDASDIAQARRKSVDPGGQIMIHGQPNNPRFSPQYYAQNDWTDGCIAVTNADMDEIWLMTRTNTTVIIEP